MDFDLQALLAAHRTDGYELYGRYLNPQQPKVLHTIGFDKVYERAEGAYLYDSDGHQYADFLSGFGVFAAGRNHPVIRQALHQALDAELADWTQFDCGPLPGLLAAQAARTPDAIAVSGAGGYLSHAELDASAGRTSAIRNWPASPA